MNPVSLLFHDIYLTDPRESGFASAAADRYKLPVREFDAQLEALAQTAQPFLLTVDDGGVSYYTLLAERVERRGWTGHCFVTTSMIGRPGFLSAPQIRELDARGHIIGSHSVTHPARFSALSADDMRREWTESRHTLEDLLGHAVTVASVPGGYYSRGVAETAAGAGFEQLFNSEPTTAGHELNRLRIAGRYTIRRGDPADAAARLVGSMPWARCAAWTSWNAKGILKPLLGPSYRRVADWVLAGAQGTRTSCS